MNETWGVRIYDNFETNSTQLLFFRREGSGCRVINFFSGETCFVDRGAQIPSDYTMKIPSYLSQEILGRLAEALSKHGVKTDNDLNGVLVATKEHLKDMRRLVFLNCRKGGEG